MTKPTPTQYALGQQDDGSIIIRLPDEAHRRVTQRAIEKQIKNTGSAEGTVSALDDGTDPFLALVRSRLEAVQQLLVGARPPGAQLDGTPIGAALASAETRTEPITWAPSVPEPRPKVGDLVRWPTGQTESLIGVRGYDADLGAFAAESTQTQFGSLVASPVAGEWRLMALLLNYDTADSLSMALDGALDTAHDLTATNAAGSVTDTSHTGAGNQSVRPPRAPSAQRERNAARAGVGKPTAPKAPATPKKATPASPKKKGGK